MSVVTIGKAAKQVGVGIDTVRYYERAGLLPAARRSAGGYRQYSQSDVQRLRFIRRAKRLGFSLDEIAELLALSDDGADRQEVKRIAERRLAELEQKLAELGAIRDTLAALVRRCSGRGPLVGCPIIDTVVAHDSDVVGD